MTLRHSSKLDDLEALGIEQLRRGYQEGSLDPVVVAQTCLAQIDTQDSDLHAFITVSRSRAITDAMASRERWRSGRPLSPCDGIPIAIKDNIDVAGLPCTAGTAAFRQRIASDDALVAARLRAAGTVLLGKLNMHEAALGATTDNPVFGRCMNPLHPGHTPGGSSGGSGAAVAAHLVSVALGTDTMGSIRIPAAYCGVFGFKPGHRPELNQGVIPLHLGLDAPGPLARSALDLAWSARLLLGLPARVADVTPGVQRGWSGLRVARLREAEQADLDPAIANGLESLTAELSALGAQIAHRSLPEWHPGAARRSGLLLCEAAGRIWWEQQLGPGLEGLSAELIAMLRYPTTLLPDRMVRAERELQTLKAAALQLFDEVDLLLLPTTAQPSFMHGLPAPVQQADLTALANFIGAPALAIPLDCAGTTGSVQLVAAPGRDEDLLSLAMAIDAIGTRSISKPFARVPLGALSTRPSDAGTTEDDPSRPDLRPHAEWLRTQGLGAAAQAACAARDPEEALGHLVRAWVGALGDRQAYLRPGSLREGERQSFIGGCFMVTPDHGWHLLVAGEGFPQEQRRLMIPIDAGHPGRVRASGEPMLLANTDEHGDFRQYLKSSRMGSSIYAPLHWEGQFIGQIVMAAQARWTLRASDLAVLIALAPLAAALWIAKGGPKWLERHYPPADGFRVDAAGVDRADNR